MDPCQFVRVLVGNLAIKMPTAAPRGAAAGSGVHPTTSPCYCKIRLNNLPYQTASAPLAAADDQASGTPQAAAPPAAVFHLSKADLDRRGRKPGLFYGCGRSRLKVAIYSGRRGSTCGVSSGRLLGKISLPVDLKVAATKAVVFHTGWVALSWRVPGKSGGGGRGAHGHLQVSLTVRAEPDPRFVFEFDGETACSPQVLQVQGAIKQPMFTCKFSCRNVSDLHLRTRTIKSETGNGRCWFPSFGTEREMTGKERKGWSVTVHDLSGSPVALASMVTPFVPSPGTDRVSRSNPGAWLVLRPGDGTWKPWGRLEAWRERGGPPGGDALGYRFELLPEHSTLGTGGVSVTESSISTGRGGRFVIDLTSAVGTPVPGSSPGCSPRGSGDFGHYGLWPLGAFRGFVTSASVAGEKRGGRPTVEVGVQHVGCAEDAAAFVALAAAVDLSMEACRLFSHRLIRELTQSQTDRALLR